MGGMRRYLDVFGLFWGTSLGAEMEYRANFVITLITSLGHLAGNLFGLFLFYRTGYEFPGWSWQAAMIVLGVYTVVHGFSVTLLSPNLSRIVRHVQQGTLDFILLKPIDSQFWLSARSISLWGLADVAFGAAIIVYAGSQLGLHPAAYLRLVPAITCACIILYSLWFVLAATSIWFVKVYNATEVLSSLMDAGRFPMAAYPSAYRIFFTFVVPVAFLTTVPAQTLLGEASPSWMLSTLALAVVLLVVCRAFWAYALRFYTSASS